AGALAGRTTPSLPSSFADLIGESRRSGLRPSIFVMSLKRRARDVRRAWLSSHWLGAPVGATQGCALRGLGPWSTAGALAGRTSPPSSSFADLIGESSTAFGPDSAGAGEW